MKVIETILSKLEDCILNSKYDQIETDRVELKDNSHSNADWVEVYKTSCAFLNTDGGIIILGIKEDEQNKKYIFTGFDASQESKIKEIPKLFANEEGTAQDLNEFFPTFEILDFQNGKVLCIYVEKLPEELKYVFYKGKAYYRKMTGDHKIEDSKIRSHNEYKAEIANARELVPITKATLSDLNIDRLNEYIQLLNRETKIENLKSDILSASSFLERKGFIKDNVPTLLGMLVCGEHPEDFLGNRCQVDCYLDYKNGNQIAENRKIFRGNILPIMENSVNFVYSNIKIGISIEKGGTSIPEYPQDIIRESINNSLAHRDYSIDKFTSIVIIPNDSIEIRNPGRFKNQLIIDLPNDIIPIRRIIPNPKPVNPRLADVLKVFNKWEGRGIGMATLVNECLDNKINLPYYRFYGDNDLSLVIPSGKLLDSNMEMLFKTFDGFIYEMTGGRDLDDEQKLVIAYLYKSEIENRNYRYTILITPDNNRVDAIRRLEETKLIEKHSQSTSIHPIFILNRVLMKTEYYSELRKIFGENFDNLDNFYKDVLSIIYQFNEFSKTPEVSANMVGNRYFYSQYGNVTDVKTYDNFKRKVRNVINKVKEKEYIIDVSKNRYQINKDFKGKKSLFDK